MPKGENNKSACLIFVYALTPMHPGTGTSLGVVDLPVQRERMTGYPIVQGSSLKGVLRAKAMELNGKRNGCILTVFGPETDAASDHAGCLSLTDARVLAFPVRSVAGVFAWITCPGVLARLGRDAVLAGIEMPWKVPGKPGRGKALVAGGCSCFVDDAKSKVVLEEYEFETSEDLEVQAVAEWAADVALPGDEAYDFWRKKLKNDLIVLSDDDFVDFVRTATEVVSRTRLNYETKTVESGALWSEEFLPSETIMYSVAIADKPFANKGKCEQIATAHDVIDWLTGLEGIQTVQIGADETVGKGLCRLTFLWKQ